MKRMLFDDVYDAVEEYAHYKLTATLNGVCLSATSVGNAHRDKTIAHWQTVGATDIEVTPVENALEMPVWYVVIQTNSKKHPTHHLTIPAHCEETARRKAKEQTEKKLRVWFMVGSVTRKEAVTA